MSKKRSFGSSGQVTIFIILGILLLFGFLSMMYLTGSVKQEQLKTEQTKFTSNLFQKEAMRLYVEDCLEDELENGLILLGKQGRIWEDQPGGTKPYAEGKNGASYDGERVLFGISREEYSSFQNAYPCNNDTAPTEFCRYKHPDLKVGFGILELKESTLEEDLQRYLINRTLWCVENFTKSNISQNAELVTKKLDLTVDIIQEGINVKVYFPLKLKIGKEEFSQLTQFDFFYPSRFNDLLDAAVARPLKEDYTKVNFNYTQSFLESPEFGYYDTYLSLGVQMEKQETSNGDNFFKFTPVMFSVLNKPVDYSFHIARQNRPPALDYVERLACPSLGYDYLVIEGDNSSLGEINITLNALDPDEDGFNYSFNEVLASWIGAAGGKKTINNSNLYVSKDLLQQNWYNFTANATDEHNLSDWQTVRVLVDRPLTVNVTFSSPYADIEGMSGGVAIVSPEDPAFINLILPNDSLVPNASPQITLNYSNDDGITAFGYEIPSVEIPISPDGCYSFPLKTGKKCKLASYGAPTEIIGLFPDNTFGLGQTNGLLNLSYSMDYCSNLNASKSVEIPVYVAPCVPHKNPERPFAYPYHIYKFLDYNFTLGNGTFDQKETGTTTGFNPLEATHSCCIGVPENPGGWKLVDENDLKNPCFVNPAPGCYGVIADYLKLEKNYGGYVLEKEMQLCDGTRGNVCEGGPAGELWDDKLTCGENNKNKCNGISSKCQGLPAFGLIPDKGWCYGKMGCEKLCPSSQSVVSLDKYNNAPTEMINARAKNNQLLSDGKELGFVCGCSGHDGSTCDSNFNGFFSGKCDGGKCKGDN
ncbi:hypothetical protein HZC30_00430 [Candidatus Woesearchaeota archaeon]|nr:hypothetical protein [Candidatus Woesearchaeota archaeon]